MRSSCRCPTLTASLDPFSDQLAAGPGGLQGRFGMLLSGKSLLQEARQGIRIPRGNIELIQHEQLLLNQLQVCLDFLRNSLDQVGDHMRSGHEGSRSSNRSLHAFLNASLSVEACLVGDSLCTVRVQYVCG